MLLLNVIEGKTFFQASLAESFGELASWASQTLSMEGPVSQACFHGQPVADVPGTGRADPYMRGDGGTEPDSDVAVGVRGCGLMRLRR